MDRASASEAVDLDSISGSGQTKDLKTSIYSFLLVALHQWIVGSFHLAW